MHEFRVKKVAVLGAGVMGAQIAAHLVNVRIPVVLFDLPAKEGPKNGLVLKAIDQLKKLKPAPLGLAEDAERIVAANYEDDLPVLQTCDLIIEAIAERMDWKVALYQQIAPHVAPHTLVASNTSGLSITTLSQALPEALRSQFCGVHFFNPPRYMALVELIPTAVTRAEMVDELETFMTRRLGKSVVRAKDTPNFIANRVGVAAMLSTMHQAEQFGLSYDVVDDLTGKRLGRASSATFRTADVVGLDTMAHVIKTMQDHLHNDPFYASYATPPVLSALIEKGALGQKTKAGFFKKEGAVVLRLDPAKATYVAAGAKADELIGRILKKPAPERLKLLRESGHPQAQFLWAILRDMFHYAAVHLAEIADSARDVDLAIRWGFGYAQGPFELWQEAGWQTVAQWVSEDIVAGKALCSAPLPDWVFDGRQGVHSPQGSWSPARQTEVGRSTLPVYQRQAFVAPVAGDGALSPLEAGETVYENDDIRLWTFADHDVLIASFKTKMHTITGLVVEGLNHAVDLAEQKYAGLVLWQGSEPFSAGANLEEVMPLFMSGGGQAIGPAVKNLQDLVLRLRYARVPTVAAISGLALGGGCELSVAVSRRVAAMETYIGLVEVGIGLIPAGGGLTYIARRASEKAKMAGSGVDVFSCLKDSYTHAAMARVATSGLEAMQLGYLQSGDVVLPHKEELLHVAIGQVKSMADAGYQAPLPSKIAVAGRSGLATIRGQLVNMRDGGFISAHDHLLGQRIAEVVCGGDVDDGSVVDESYLMALERRYFCELLDHPKTQERILGLLNTGKPVRN